MTIDDKYLELINADIDGELDEAGKRELAEYLATNEEAQQAYDELAALCGQLDAVEAVEPPPHLKYAILDSVPKKPAKAAAAEPAWRSIFAMPIFRHAAAFAAGIVMTLALVNSNQISNQAFDDVTGLVGTISDEAPVGYETINLAENELAGTVSITSNGDLMVLDFSLTAAGPVQIVADFPERHLGFRGFAQLDNDNASVSADAGSVTMSMEGKNRYAMFLHHRSATDSEINLRFYAAGDLIHEEGLPVRRTAANSAD